MVDAPQCENLDMDTIMVDAPPLPEDPTALPKEIEEILLPLSEDRDATALPKASEEILPPLPEDPTALPKEIEEILAGVNVNPTDLNPALNQNPSSPPDPANAAQGPPARETEYQRLQRRRIELADELAQAKSSWPRVKKGPNQQDLKKILLTDGESVASRSSAKT
jgi:hypothetical protein